MLARMAIIAITTRSSMRVNFNILLNIDVAD
jgi:hypothetical protein